MIITKHNWELRCVCAARSIHRKGAGKICEEKSIDMNRRLCWGTVIFVGCQFGYRSVPVEIDHTSKSSTCYLSDNASCALFHNIVHVVT